MNQLLLHEIIPFCFLIYPYNCQIRRNTTLNWKKKKTQACSSSFLLMLEQIFYYLADFHYNINMVNSGFILPVWNLRQQEQCILISRAIIRRKKWNLSKTKASIKSQNMLQYLICNLQKIKSRWLYNVWHFVC